MPANIGVARHLAEPASSMKAYTATLLKVGPGIKAVAWAFALLLLNGTAGTVLGYTATEIITAAPAGAATGTIQVTTPSASVESTTPFAATALRLPVIASVSPPSGVPGSSIVIQGTNFTGTTGVSFNGKPAAFTLASPARIIAIAPAGATAGPIRVTTPAGTATSPRAFTPTTFSAGVFATVNHAVGAAVTPAGEVFVSGCDSPCFSSIVTALTKTGAVRGTAQTGGLTSFAGHAAFDTASGNVWTLQPDGTLLAINPTTLAVTVLTRLKTLVADTSSIYDISTGTTDGFGGLIVPQLSSFGDFAITQRNGETYVFIAGLSSAQTFPFIMRMRIRGNTIVENKVLVSSRVPNASGPRLQPVPGVAVNARGTVLTTLPVGRTPEVSVNVPVRFGADFQMPGTTGGTPSVVRPFFNGRKISLLDLQSDGIDVDGLGNFYVATSAAGSAVLGAPGQALVVIFPPSLAAVTAYVYSGVTPSTYRDVAVDSEGKALYVIYEPSAVLRLTGLVP